MYNLKARHVDGKPYTRTGDIIIAVNPYQWMNDLYLPATRMEYAQALVYEQHVDGDARTRVEPHVYETSSLAYRGLAVEDQHQSILVSGESGAGKTETVKILMSHLASVQARTCHDLDSESIARNLSMEESFGASPIVQRVLDSNPLLEAFGNAKTVRNDNSSRFGKYIQLQFDVEDATMAAYSGRSIPNCILAGSKCEVYLLEKSRVVGHEEEERAYHVFYQLLAAPEDIKRNLWEGLEGTDNESFKYVGWTDTDTIEGKTDGERFELTLKALALVGVEGEKLKMLMRAICIVLQLGNLVFEPDENDEERADISNKEELEKLATLMGVTQEDIKNSLTLRTVRARNEEYKVPLNAVKAKDSCDAFAKEIYAKAFLWLVRTINDATCAEKNYNGDKDDDFGIIALLDIFGFESFETNRFEQLCINYANEKLQQKFTQDIFRSVQTEYEYEGIELGEITYDDNVDVLNLVEGRMGLIAVLNEECVRPKGNDNAFVNKIQTMNKDQSCLFIEKSFHEYEFGVNHYAGPVVYDANNFVTKNMDSLPSDLMDCAHKSTNDIVSKELENEAMMNSLKPAPRHSKKGAKPQLKRAGSSLISATVWTKFKNQLGALMANLGQTRSRYIRCIKPNTEKKPRIMQHISTTEQLRCAGVVAAVTISRSAFPNRLEHEIVMSRFKSLWIKGAHHATVEDGDDGEPKDQMREDVEILLDNALKCLEVEKGGTVVRAFVIGKTRAYFRAGALEHLESERLKGLSDWAVELQRMGRGFTKRSQYLRMRASAIKGAAKMRRFVARRKFLRLKYACIILQCWARCNMAAVELNELRRNHMATMIQTHWRMKVAEAMLKKSIAATVLIQAQARGAIQRPKYQADLIEKREEAKLENQLKALQRKLEEAEARRIEAEKKAAAQPTVVYREAEVARGEKVEEKEGEKEEVAAPALSDEEGPSVDVASEAATSSMVGPSGLTAQQQTLMDESGKMLEYLRKEVFKLRSQNTQLRTDFDLLKENNQRLMDANASAGASFAALNQHAKQLNKTNAKLMAEVSNYKQQLQKMNIVNLEIKEELKMKQATYVAEVHSRLQYQKTMARIVQMVEDRCRDSRLVEDVLAESDECEDEYMSGPTGMSTPSRRSIFSDAFSSPQPTSDDPASEAGVMGRFKSFFSS